MLLNTRKLHDYKLLALDGEIGKAKEFYFDDQHWTIRYLVADTGNWLSSKKVLVSPYALGRVLPEKRDISVNLTKKQIEDSPPLESDKPVSRQFERSYYGYYGWPIYWGGSSMWGNFSYIERDPSLWPDFVESEKNWDSHLQSTQDVKGYSIQARDGEVGHVEDFLIDEGSWAIRYLIVNTQNWWPGKRVLVSPKWIERIDWDEANISVNLSREAIKHSAEYDGSPLTRDYEVQLHKHYGRPGYWADSGPLPRRHL